MNEYYYLDYTNQRQGPVSEQELLAAGISPTTLVWKQGMSNWTAASEVPELAAFFPAEPTAAEAPQPELQQPQQSQRPYAQPQQPQQPYAQPQQPYGPQPQQPYAPQSQYGPQTPIGGQPYAQPSFGPPPDNYLVWAILSTICCCFPAGVVSIVYSTKVNSLYRMGQVRQAEEAAENAKKWACISAGISCAMFVLSLVFSIISNL